MSKKATPTHREIKVDDEFGRKARSPGGLARDVALKRAAAELAQIKPRLEDYIRAEAEHLQAALLAARTRDGNFMANIRNAYAASRNIRDVAHSVGYPLAGFITANLCIVIETADAATGDYPAEVIDCHYEAFRLALSPGYLNSNPDQLPELSNGLLQIVKIAITVATRATSPDGPADGAS